MNLIPYPWKLYEPACHFKVHCWVFRNKEYICKYCGHKKDTNE